MAMTITYKVKNGIYVNMTNRCPCACTFCLRQNAPGMEPARHADIAGCKIRGKQRCDPEPEQQPPVRPRSGGGRGLRRRKLREGEQRRRNGRGLRLRRAAQQVQNPRWQSILAVLATV